MSDYYNGQVDFRTLENALEALKSGLQKVPNELERDGAIQRFEFTYELCWKAIRRCLIAMGRAEVSGSPKPILRDALVERLIPEVETWFESLEIRNSTSHIYDKHEAEKAYDRIKHFPPHVDALILKLKERGKNG